LARDAVSQNAGPVPVPSAQSTPPEELS